MVTAISCGGMEMWIPHIAEWKSKSKPDMRGIGEVLYFA
jgi:hypothetical protein